MQRSRGLRSRGGSGSANNVTLHDNHQVAWMQPWHVFGGSINVQSVAETNRWSKAPRGGPRVTRWWRLRGSNDRIAAIGCSVRSSRSSRQFMTIGIAAVTRPLRNAARLPKTPPLRHLIKLVQLAASARKDSPCCSTIAKRDIAITFLIDVII